MNDTHITTDDLIDYLHGALPAERDALVFTHLEGCTLCRTARDTETALTDALRLAAGPEEELPGMVRARVWEAVRNERPSWLVALQSALRPAIAVPVAAIAAVGIYFALPVAHPNATHPGGVAVGYYFDQYAAANAQTPLLERTPDFTAVPVTSQKISQNGAVEAATLDDDESGN